MNQSVQFDADRTVEPGRIVFRTQTPGDATVLAKVCPFDQTVVLVGRWDGIHFFIERAPEGTPAAQASVAPDAAEFARVNALNDGDLQTLAATRNVVWDKAASRETMVRRVVDAGLEPIEPPTPA